MLYVIKADQNQNYLRPNDNFSPDKVLGMFVQCSSGVVRHPRDLQVSVATHFCRVLIFALHVCSFRMWYPIEGRFGMSCKPFRYQLKSISVL